MKYEKREKNPGQLYIKWGAQSYLEIMSPTDSFDMVTINVGSFGKDYKRIEQISCYVELPKFFSFCKLIEFGVLQRKVEEERKLGKDYPDAIWEDNGGTVSYVTGAIEGRKIKMIPGKKTDVAFVAERGKGYTTKTGGIQIDYNAGNIARVLCGVSYSELYEIAVYCQARLQAYLVDQQIKGKYTYTRTEPAVPTPVPTPIPNSLEPVGRTDRDHGEFRDGYSNRRIMDKMYA